jgi:predicted RNA-binding Zn ribbon-like protein
MTLFAYDTEQALLAVADLINSTGNDGDTLTTVGELDSFLKTWRYAGSRRRDRAELDSVRALRPVLRRLWLADEDEAVRLVNDMLEQRRARPYLVKHDEWDYHLHATPLDAPLADRIAVEAAMAFVDVVRMKELDRLRICAADDCDDVHVDLSKNRSRRFCSTTCSNRVNVSAYRARKSRKAAPRS